MSETEQIHHDQPQTLLFSYGTLKRDFPNYPLMQNLISQNDAVHLGTYTTHHPYPLVLGPYNIPFLINLKGTGFNVTGELFSVSDRGLGVIDEFEGTSRGHYDRLPIEVSKEGDDVLVNAMAYFASEGFGERLWERRGRVGLREYSESDGGGYVKKCDRDNNSSFVDDVWKFIHSSD